MLNFRKFSSQTLVIISGFTGFVVGIIFILLFQSAVTAQPYEQQETLSQKKKDSKRTVPGSLFADGDPFASMEKMRDKMFKGFGQFDDFGDSFFDVKRSGLSNRQSYSLNQRETDENFIYEINLEDGVDGKSLDIKVEDGFVTISGKTQMKNETKDDLKNSFFSPSSSFSQSFSLPEYVDAENVQIQNNKNKITLIFPKVS